MRSRLIIPAALASSLAFLALALANGRTHAAGEAQRAASEPLAVLVVRNPLPFDREEVAEAWVPQTQLPIFLVRGPDGKTAQAQRVEDEPTRPLGREAIEKIAFLVKVPARGVASYDVDHAVWPDEGRGGKRGLVFVPPDARNPYAYAARHTLENGRFKVEIDEAGDLASIYDKSRRREALVSPVRLDRWGRMPVNADPPPRAASPATIRVVERGPVRAAIEIARVLDGSRLVQTVRLAAGGAGDRVEIVNRVDWKSREADPGGPPTAYKAAFRLTTPHRKVTFGSGAGRNPGEGAGARGGWIDLASVEDGYGVGVLNPDGLHFDQPGDGTLRLTLFSPGPGAGSPDPRQEDLVRFWIAPHAGDWRKGRLPQAYERVDRPIQTFTSPRSRSSRLAPPVGRRAPVDRAPPSGQGRVADQDEGRER